MGGGPMANTERFQRQLWELIVAIGPWGREAMNRHEFLEVSVEAGIATVRLNRPPHNAMQNGMMREFNAALEGLAGDRSLSAIVIRAMGKAFSAGVDVADHANGKVVEMIELLHGIYRHLAMTDALTIAAVQGPALGGGCELACCCDIVLASDKAKFGQPEVQAGVFQPVTAVILPLQVGMKKAVELTVLGTTIDADEAHRIGLVNQIYPAAEFEACVDRYLDGVRRLSRPVMRLAKRAATLGQREQILSHLKQTESMYIKELMKLSDAHEGIVACIENREPLWKHA